MSPDSTDSQETKNLKETLVEFYKKNQSLLANRKEYQSMYEVEKNRNFQLESDVKIMTKEISKNGVDAKKILRLEKKISGFEEKISLLHEKNDELEANLKNKERSAVELTKYYSN